MKKAAGFFPGKALGQHFLHDQNIVRKILNAIDPQPAEHFVEIGPGRGALTVPLLAVVHRLDVVELDRVLADELQRNHDRDGFTVHRANALKFDFSRLASAPRSLRLAGNLPYNISTPLLFHLLDHQDLFRDLHVMLQKEVVERMTAVPGTKAYGRLTIALAARCRVQSLFVVRPGAFTPPPRVDSAVARLVPDDALARRIPDPAAFDRLLIRAFSMRRKRLANALKGLLSDAEIRSAGVDPDLRPGAVPPQGYVELARQAARIN